mgnify:CR=1 FL=1
MLSGIFNLLDSRGRRLIVLISAIILVLSAILLLLLNSTKLRDRLEHKDVQTLESIIDEGKLVAICETSTISFFKNRNISMGFEYEILKHIAHELNLKLEVLPYTDAQEMNRALIENRGHLIADFRVIGNKSPNHFIHSKPHRLSVISLVQRKPSKKEKNPVTFVQDIYDLDGQTIHVQVNSIAHKKLKYFADEYALNLRIVALNDSREELLEKVADGEINYTIIEREIIAANRQLFTNLDYSLNMSFPYRIAFTMKGNAVALRDTINVILDSFVLSPAYDKLVDKYIESEFKNFHRKIGLLLLNGRQISKLDKIIKTEAAKISWDWRLLSALIYKESRFEAYATSRQGTYGLMQFMPKTGAKFGVYPNSTPEAQIEGGVKYLAHLQKTFSDITDLSQRPKFVLAAYNGGPAHIKDARCVAAHFNEDDKDWHVVAKYLKKLNQPDIYNLDCVQYGPYNGGAAVNYVQTVLTYYNEWSEIYPEK